jgi:hypothetical protein
VKRREGWYSKPLLIYLPAFALGLAGENIIAGAGNDVSAGFLLLIAFAGVSHRLAFNFRDTKSLPFTAHAAA